MDFDNLRQVKIIVRGLKFMGVWKLDGLPQRFYMLYIIFTYCTIGLTTVSYTINLMLVDDFEILVSYLYIFLTVLGCFMKIHNILIFRREYYFKFFSLMDDVDYKPGTDSELKYYKKELKFFRYPMAAFIMGPAVVCFLAYLTPFLVSDTILPYPCWFPFDWKVKENYWYAYGAVVCGMNQTCFVCVFLDLFHWFILCYMAVIYKVLIYRLEALGRNVKRDMELPELIKVMVFHRKVQKMVNDCQIIVSVPIFIQLTIAALVICFTAFQLQRMSILETPGPFLQFVDYALLMSMQIFIPCFYGNEIKINSGDLNNALYNSNWIDMDIKTKKMVHVYMEYLKRPVILKAGNFFEIGLGVFTTVMNNAYSFFALLMTMND